MKTKIIFCAFVVSCYAGCYNTVQLSREEFTMNEQSDIRVVTKDGKKYEVAKEQYHVLGDSLYLIGAFTIGTETFILDERHNRSIPLSDIATIETKELDTWKTIYAVGAVATIGLMVTAVLVLQSAWH